MINASGLRLWGRNIMIRTIVKEFHMRPAGPWQREGITLRKHRESHLHDITPGTGTIARIIQSWNWAYVSRLALRRIVLFG